MKSNLRDTSSALSGYAALERASAEMLQAARKGDWDSVCRLEGACTVVIGRLRAMVLGDPLTERDQPDRMRMLRAILANDAEIRRICEPLPETLDPHSFHVEEASRSIH